MAQCPEVDGQVAEKGTRVPPHGAKALPPESERPFMRRLPLDSKARYGEFTLHLRRIEPEDQRGKRQADDGEIAAALAIWPHSRGKDLAEASAEIEIDLRTDRLRNIDVEIHPIPAGPQGIFRLEDDLGIIVKRFEPVPVDPYANEFPGNACIQKFDLRHDPSCIFTSHPPDHGAQAKAIAVKSESPSPSIVITAHPDSAIQSPDFPHQSTAQSFRFAPCVLVS
ncbi:MAG: hypothetical protein ACTHJQ_21195 [Rhizobiaceae bacterium]